MNRTARDDFVALEASADVTVVIVTYDSADAIGALLDSLRAESGRVRMRVVVADNASRDGTLAAIARHPGVHAVATGGNLGYAGGINAALRVTGTATPVLILNPDLGVRPGAVTALLAALHRHPRAGIVAPRIVDDAGRTSVSLFREPGVVRSVADAVLGRLWSTRPGALSEWVRDPRVYASERSVDWVSGAALLISAEAAAAVGDWDERYFLYSEETDYCRRTRDAGYEIRYEPEAVVEHSQGGSGSSRELDALLAVNRIRYARRYAPRRAAAIRWAAVIGAGLRHRSSPNARYVFDVLRDERRWASLPTATPREAKSVLPATSPRVPR